MPGTEAQKEETSKEASETGKPKLSMRRKAAIAAMIVCIAGALACGGVFVAYQMQLAKAAQDAEPAPAEVEELAENPIDFATLQQENPDIYAWIAVPNTQVNYPILQHPTDNQYYLGHTKNHEESIAGAIYTELYNSKDFNDPVTVIYGHDLIDGQMFTTLHDFENREFFDATPVFYIYTPGHIYTYTVLAAQGFDDDHILFEKDYRNPEQFSAYVAKILNPGTEQSNIRDGISVESDSKLVQLSTCNYTFGNPRYVLTGVLTEDQKTE